VHLPNLKKRKVLSLANQPNKQTKQNERQTL